MRSRLFRRPPPPPRQPLRWIPSKLAHVSVALAATEDADTFAAAVNLDLAVQLAATEAADAFSGSVNLDAAIQVAATEASDSFAGAVNLDLAVQLAATEAADTFAGTLGLGESIVLAATEDPDLFAGQLTLDFVIVTLAASEDSDSFSGAVTAEQVESTGGVRPEPPFRPQQAPPIAEFRLSFIQVSAQRFEIEVEVSTLIDLDFDQEEPLIQLSAEVSSEFGLTFEQEEQAFEMMVAAIPVRNQRAVQIQPKHETLRTRIEFEQEAAELEITVEVA